jgi:disease resistance protein RPM1
VNDKIIKKCGRLSLALFTIGGLLASKSLNKEKWEKVLTRLGSELKANPSAYAMKRILDLSYIDLWYHLKSCLLHLSLFSDDYEIKRMTLVCRLMAKGYVRGRRDMTSKELAEKYFYELINRSLIRSSKVGDDGRIKSCRNMTFCVRLL